ncbi:hypothetical protein COO60DRAFT_36762 [Scenedesmus sp. NREL 46B-D3]|nr:hypothetical protein COO60DRAFT_36762 [Scenedesmus sp. NREL 46B-D3]
MLAVASSARSRSPACGRHIRQHGAVVARFDVYSDFDSFFADKRNAQAVYRPSASAYFQFYHAITLVGYNNERQYWLVKNSCGSSWADNGLFKVAYGVCAIMAADKGEAFGIVWTPSSTPAAQQLPVTPGPRPGCHWYKVRRIAAVYIQGASFVYCLAA